MSGVELIFIWRLLIFSKKKHKLVQGRQGSVFLAEY